ncbi:hypothetical protein D3C77_659670 [compost metagenome]
MRRRLAGLTRVGGVAGGAAHGLAIALLLGEVQRLAALGGETGEVRILLTRLGGVAGQQRVFGFGQGRQAQAAGQEDDPAGFHGAVSGWE